MGESGSGKSVTSLAVMRLLDRAGRITGGQIRFEGRDITNASHADLRRLRGSALSMIFQNPRAALNPIRTVEQQIVDVLAAHDRLPGRLSRRPPAPRRSSCCGRCASAIRRRGCRPIRTSCRAACASAS